MALSIGKISENLAKLEGWELSGQEITKTFEFKDFKEAMEFVNEVASLAEEMKHHPSIDIRWNKVALRMSTHTENSLTDKDFELAEKVNNLKEP